MLDVTALTDIVPLPEYPLFTLNVCELVDGVTLLA
jgi:hypothetical protein